MMDNEELTFKQYLERFVPNLTPDEFEALHYLYHHGVIDYDDLDYWRDATYLVLRGFAEWIDKQFYQRRLYITEAGKAKYLELTAASSAPPQDGVE